MFRRLLDFGFPVDPRFQYQDDGSDHYTPIGGESPPVDDSTTADVGVAAPDVEPVVDPVVEPDLVEPVEPVEPVAPAQTPEERLSAMETQLAESAEALRQSREENELTRGFMERIDRRLPPPVQADPQVPQWHFNATDQEMLVSNPDKFIPMLNEKLATMDAYYDREMNARSTARVEQASTQSELRKTFYSKHTDLVGKEDIVRLVTRGVYEANPRANPNDILDKIADAARAKLTALGVPTPKPKSKASGSRVGNARTRVVKDGEKSEYQKTLEYKEKRG